MLSRQEAIALLSKYARGADWTKHCLAVAEATIKVGHVLAKNRSIDCSFIWSAALLHDIGRYMTHDPLLHGVEGYKLLSMLGHEKEAYVCASHILFGLNAAEARQLGLPNHDFLPRTIEEKLVPLVDYLIEYDQPTTLDRRFSSLRERNCGNTFFVDRLDRAQEIARTFMLQIEDEIGESVERIVAYQ
ncbi:MAG: HDIG domain-containing protein [Deltaproteobacteria bacterium]|nr:HDIG domain-containing protein [Deltaproteobacteria bacterium]MBW2355213.1 HDIG domain-containing protein [Deltaproteobacteria bacterium]